MRVGIVCPYSFDVPGGVQFHVRDLAERLITLGHEVSVLAPADDDTPVPAYVQSAGRAVPVRYNGSVARVTLGPVSAARVRRWLEDGDFDVVHLHEPLTPSLSALTLRSATGPIVATFHTANLRSRAMQAAQAIFRPLLDKIDARIAVSEDARRTLVDHVGGDAVVIPNGVYVDRFASAATKEAWQGRPGHPTIAFLGRLDEPRKGLAVLVEALPALRDAHPGLRVLVAGRGDPDEITDGADLTGVEFLGMVDDDAKASLLASVDAYVAPHTGGESFGIVLVEAMSAQVPVVASDLGAFRRVLEDGDVGVLFPVGDAAALAKAVSLLLDDEERRRELVARASVAVRRYDWGVVAQQVLAVYETVLSGAAQVGEEPEAPALWSRWRPS